MKRTVDWNTYSPGRPLKGETIAHAEGLLKEAKAFPGIRSAEASRKIGISSQRGAQLARMLEARGLITIVAGPGYLEMFPKEG